MTQLTLLPGGAPDEPPRLKPPRRVADLVMTEVTFLARVEYICDAYRLEHYHTRDSRGSNPGFPDLVIAGPGGVLFRELKTPGNSLSVSQRRWASSLTTAGADFAVWFPRDFPSGRIDRELRAISQLQARLDLWDAA